MSPMLVYFLMMADDIRCLFRMLAAASAVALVVTWFVRGVIFELKDEPDGLISASKRLPWLCAAFVCTATLIPSTKTIAAMVVLPKITSPQALDAMGSEAKELYGLAKDALRNLAGDDKPAKSDK